MTTTSMSKLQKNLSGFFATVLILMCTCAPFENVEGVSTSQIDNVRWQQWLAASSDAQQQQLLNPLDIQMSRTARQVTTVKCSNALTTKLKNVDISKCKAGTAAGATCEVKCKPNFVGASTQYTCTKGATTTGSWSGTMPKCVAACPHLQAKALNMDVSQCKPSPERTPCNVIITCPDGVARATTSYICKRKTASSPLAWAVVKVGSCVNPLPKDCQGSWVKRGDCSASCGLGSQQYEYVVTRRSLAGGKACPFAAGSVKTEQCQVQPCSPGDCVGSWQVLNPCSVSCGSGVQQFQYQITSPATSGGQGCPASDGQIDTQTCNMAPCFPVNCMGSWQPTTPCSATCGEGQQSFKFTVTQPAKNGGTPCATLDGNTKVDSCQVPLSSCGCAPMANAVAVTCVKGGPSVPTACVAGYYVNGNACTPCTGVLNAAAVTCTNSTISVVTKCSSNFYRSADQTQCTACAATCEKGKYESTACTTNSNRGCTSCLAISNAISVQCTSPTTSTVTACKAGFYAAVGAKSCAACSIPVGAVSVTCSSAADIIIDSCKVGYYKAGDSRSCIACSPLANVELAQCSSSADSTVVQCAAGFFKVSDRECQQCDSCIAGRFASIKCTTETNRVCMDCRSLCVAANEYENATCTLEHDRQCATCRGACAAGTYEDAQCSGTHDRICLDCPTILYATSVTCAKLNNQVVSKVTACIAGATMSVDNKTCTPPSCGATGSAVYKDSKWQCQCGSGYNQYYDFGGSNGVCGSPVSCSGATDTLLNNACGSVSFCVSSGVLSRFQGDRPTGAVESCYELSVASEGVTGIAPGVFDGLVNLKVVDLSNNRISSLLPNTFAGLRAIEEIDMHSNNFNLVASNLFSGMTNLTKLSMQYNAFGSLPSNVFAGLTSLTSLDLSHNSLSTIEPELFADLSKLNVLDLSENVISTIPDNTFSSLAELRTLSLGLNRLDVLTSGMFNDLTSLDVLNLTQNDISSVSAELFTPLSNLRSLDLSQNSISSIIPSNAVWANCHQLQILDLSGNDLSVLQNGSFVGLSNLQYLFLPNNNIASISADAFQGLAKLLVLDLKSNGISSITAASFNGLVSLRNLYLSDNQLSTIPDGAFAVLRALTVLHLQANGISSLSSKTFGGLYSLQSLFLDDNNVSSIPNGVFEDASALLSLRICGNDIASSADLTGLNAFDESTTIVSGPVSGYGAQNIASPFTCQSGTAYECESQCV